ncbi:MAG: M24 family metallopeptidase [Dorea sp.]|jgi:Xaa-Pro aminopeptidase|uniref:aminopeptidase P family N-terminal domain-containing protein n=1 Tax=Sporofaciens sp. JLR.KK001 TaxID=3112621 RepID=UPI002172F8D1|nr:M24 family metallopeptidase [Dorea sp.]
MSIQERLKALREQMKEKKIDIYIVPTADFHQTEYVGEYFKARKYITNFSGSAGTAVITADEARLWTDGRYFIQAAEQIAGTTVELMKMGEPGVPTIKEYLADTLKAGGNIGFDGRAVAMSEGLAYEEIAKEKNGRVIYACDLIDEIWEERPALSAEPAWILEEKYAGETAAGKLSRIREYMKENGASVHVLTTLDDICWTLNMRGNDIEFFPLVLSYGIITMSQMHLYINEAKLSEEMKAQFAKDNILLHPYNDIYEDVKMIAEEESVLIDPARLNYALYSNIPDGVKKIEQRNPEVLFKAVKNPVEIENIRKAQLKDSVAHVRFMKWLKENVGKIRITEMSASEKLDEFRMEMGNFIRPSFEPISSYGEHCALMHYTSSQETDVELKEGNVFLTDTGAGFYEGSTDITRTYALGEIPDIMKEHFTLTLMGHMGLANARFLYGCTGMNLDLMARKPLWDRGLDFKCGTGHGMGYLLSIHESPAGFRWRYRAGETAVLEEGMVLTDEPGIYIEGSHGIRLENEILVRKGEQNEYGQFMYFETITYIPMDLDAVKTEMLPEETRIQLNDYHRTVYEKISPYLNDEEKEWLKKYTRAV